jgi:hypothetical protein
MLGFFVASVPTAWWHTIPKKIGEDAAKESYFV